MDNVNEVNERSITFYLPVTLKDRLPEAAFYFKKKSVSELLRWTIQQMLIGMDEEKQTSSSQFADRPDVRPEPESYESIQTRIRQKTASSDDRPQPSAEFLSKIAGLSK